MFDTSAFINGAHHHYYIESMPSVWQFVESRIDQGGIIVPREVYREVPRQDDAVSALVRRHSAAVVEPDEATQRLAGTFQQRYFQSTLRDRADPWAMAEASLRRAMAVTYEGITFSGGPARGADDKLPALCKREQIQVCTLPQALQALGLKL